MFRLPVCPHCGTIYRYKDVASVVKKRDNVCYHCGKSFRAKIFPYALVEIIILAAAAVGLNILMLSGMKELSLVPLFAVTLGSIILMIVSIPFFVKFRKNEKDSKRK